VIQTAINQADVIAAHVEVLRQQQQASEQGLQAGSAQLNPAQQQANGGAQS
jgi:hypothetical protein